MNMVERAKKMEGMTKNTESKKQTASKEKSEEGKKHRKEEVLKDKKKKEGKTEPMNVRVNQKKIILKKTMKHESKK